MDAHAPYREHQEILEAALTRTCRRFRLSPTDAEDFASEFRLRLVREDYAILKRFEGRSSLHTYLIVVVTRAFHDWRNARWGKWRPSAEATRLGVLAQRLERLIVRDRHTIDEAEEILRTNLGMPISRASLDELVARFPTRHGRRFVTEQALEHRPTAEAPPDAMLERDEAADAARHAARALSQALSQLPAEDQLILRMRFENCVAVADIARALQLEQKPLYKRIDRLLIDLRRSLERAGLTRAMASKVIAHRGFDHVGPEQSLGVPGASGAAAPTGGESATAPPSRRGRL